MASAISQSSLLVIQSSSTTRGRSQGRQRLSLVISGRWRRSASSSISFARSKDRSVTGVIHHTTHRSKGIVGVVTESEAVPSIVDSARDEGQLPLETSGGDGFGGRGSGGDGGDGKGGGGGGGGGDSNSNEGEGGSNENNNDKKNMAMSMSQKLTLGYAALVGVGGVMGYIKSGSQKSLAAGGLSALLLYYVYTQLPLRPALASSVGLGLSAALLGVMGSRFKKSGKIFPAGVVSFVSFVMAGGYLHGIMRSKHA